MPINKDHIIPVDISAEPALNVEGISRSNRRALKILTEDDWDFWIENGFVVIKKAVPKTYTSRLANLLWGFEDIIPKALSQLYLPSRLKAREESLKKNGRLESFNHQYQWDIRQYPKVYEIFADIWGREDLWVSIERGCLNFPGEKDKNFKECIHWVQDPDSSKQEVRGLLALNDQVDELVGGFQCVPELYRCYDNWKLSQAKDRDRLMPDISQFSVSKIKLEEGDLLIFNGNLPFGIRPNSSDKKVRISQYISMMPAEKGNVKLRKSRIDSWRLRISPEGSTFRGENDIWEQKKYPVAELSSLGKKLLGLDPW